MTLEGWTITDQIVAGHVPGVNVLNRPRIIYLYVLHSIKQKMFEVMSSAIQMRDAESVDIARKILTSHAIPPLSEEVMIEKERKRAMEIMNILRNSK